MTETGSVTSVETIFDGVTNSLPFLDCISVRDDGSVAFSTLWTGYLNGTPLFEQNVYTVNDTSGAVTLLFNGKSLGVDLNACDF